MEKLPDIHFQTFLYIQKQLINKNISKKEKVEDLKKMHGRKKREKKEESKMVEDDYLLCRHVTIFENVERTTLFRFPMKENCEEELGLDSPFVCLFFSARKNVSNRVNRSFRSVFVLQTPKRNTTKTKQDYIPTILQPNYSNTNRDQSRPSLIWHDSSLNLQLSQFSH